MAMAGNSGRKVKRYEANQFLTSQRFLSFFCEGEHGVIAEILIVLFFVHGTLFNEVVIPLLNDVNVIAEAGPPATGSGYGIGGDLIFSERLRGYGFAALNIGHFYLAVANLDENFVVGYFLQGISGFHRLADELNGFGSYGSAGIPGIATIIAAAGGEEKGE